MSEIRLTPIGRIRTPWTRTDECPRNSMESEALCRVEVDEAFRPALTSLEACSHVVLLYWLHEARRDLLTVTPKSDDTAHGVFALRSPSRPNPVGFAVADVVSVDPAGFEIRHVDCLDGTPLLDIKPYFASTDAKPDARVGWHERRKNPLPPRG